MFLSQLELDLQPPLVRHSHDVLSTQGKVGEPLPALDPAHADVRAQVEVGRKLSVCYGYLEGSTAGNGRYTLFARGGHLPARGGLICDQSACHRDLEARHQVRVLSEMALGRRGVVSWIERARGWGQAMNPDLSQEVAGKQCTKSVEQILLSLQ